VIPGLEENQAHLLNPYDLCFYLQKQLLLCCLWYMYFTVSVEKCKGTVNHVGKALGPEDEQGQLTGLFQFGRRKILCSALTCVVVDVVCRARLSNFNYRYFLKMTIHLGSLLD
jgi:hypothetical protein